MPFAKSHTFVTLFQGEGAPPSPWVPGATGGAVLPFQENGSLRFQGAAEFNAIPDLAWFGDLDLTDDALFLEFESLIGQPGTIELDIGFASNWTLILQLRGLNLNVLLTHGATHVVDTTVNIDELMIGPTPPSNQAFIIPTFEPLCWEVAFQISAIDPTAGTLELLWGPTAQQMRAPYILTQLPTAAAADMQFIDIISKNMESQSICYGETRLIGVNAWFPPARTAVTAIAPGALTGGTSFSGLTGHGTLALDPGTRAVRVNWTQTFTALGFEVGAPDRFFEVGWVNFTNGTISEASQVVEFEDQVLAPLTPQNASHLGYSFASPVSATITCLT